MWRSVRGLRYNFTLSFLLSTKFHTIQLNAHERGLFIKKVIFIRLCSVSRRHERIISHSERHRSWTVYRCQCHFQISSELVIGLVWNVRGPDDQTAKRRSHSARAGAGGPSSHTATLTWEEGLTPRRLHEVRPKADRKKVISRAWLGNGGIRIKEGIW